MGSQLVLVPSSLSFLHHFTFFKIFDAPFCLLLINEIWLSFANIILNIISSLKIPRCPLSEKDQSNLIIHPFIHFMKNILISTEIPQVFDPQHLIPDKFPYGNHHTPKNSRWLTHSGWEILICVTKSLSEPMLDYCQFDPYKHISVKFEAKYNSFHCRKCISKCSLDDGSLFVSASMC